MELSSGSVIGDFRLIEQISRSAFTEKWLAHRMGNESEAGLLEIVTDFTLASILKSKRAKFTRSHHSVHLFCKVCNLRTEPFYFFWEEFESRPLSDILKEKNRLQVTEAVMIFAQLLDSLDAAHSEGVLHLNLTPESVLVDSNGRVKVSGFGLGASVLALKQYLAFRTIAARGEMSSILDPLSPLTRSVVTDKEIDSLYRLIAQAEGAKLSSLVQNLGMVNAPSGADISADYAYIAPEQKENRLPDARTDIYALGVMLFQMLTGVLPKGQRITGFRPDAPAALERIFAKATAANAARYSSIKEMKQDLEPLKAQLLSKSEQKAAQPAMPSTEKPFKRQVSATPEAEPVRKAPVQGVSAQSRVSGEDRKGTEPSEPAIEWKGRTLLRSSAKPKLRNILLIVVAVGAVFVALEIIFLLRRDVETAPAELARATDENVEKVNDALSEIDKLIGADNYDSESIINRLRSLRAQADGTSLIPQIDARIEQLTQKFEADCQKEYSNLIRKFNQLLAAERFQDAIACLGTYPERFRKSAYWTEKIPADKQRAIHLGRAKDEFDYSVAKLESDAAGIKPGEEAAVLERARAIVDAFVCSYGDTPYGERLTRRFGALAASISTQVKPVTKEPVKEQPKRTPRTTVKFETWTAPSIPSNCVTALASDGRGSVICATLSGVSRYDGKDWKQMIPKDETGKTYLANENVTCVLPSGDGIWFGTPQGLVRERQGIVTLFQSADGLPGDWIVSIASAPGTEQVWAGTTSGAAIFNGQSWKEFTTKDGLADNYVNSVLATSSEILLGTRRGLTVIGTSREGAQEPVLVRTFTTANGLPCDVVTALSADSSGVWIGTEDGLCYAQGRLSSVSGIVSLTNYTTADGLPSNLVTCLAVDSGNNVYAGTRNGLAHFDGQKWTTYTKESGLAADKITALFVVGNYLYAGTHFGLTRISLALK